MEQLEAIEDIITLRASFLIDRALTGLHLDFDKALDLLKSNNNSLTDLEQRQREILVAAIDNLVDFACAQENQMLEELENLTDDESESVFEEFNLTYAQKENKDVLYASLMAGWWITIPTETLVTFMTQGDERVRAWHLSHEGLSYPKNEFPAELIPPIEWGCRCFLISDGFTSVEGAINKDKHKISVNPIFKESLAKGGRIFSTAHPYFKTKLKKEVEAIGIKIKLKLGLL